MDILGSVHEGLYNAPKLYGSKIRQPGKVTGFTSGVKEAGRGLFYGYYDGITGLVREPYEGAKTGGFFGAVKGSARSFVNATVRPAAGIVGVVAHPFQGAWKSLQTATGRKQESQIRSTRLRDGREAVKTSSPAQRADIVKKFRDAQTGTEARKAKYREIVEKVIWEDAEAERKAGTTNEGYSDAKHKVSTPLAKKISPPPLPPRTPSNGPALSPSEAEDEAAFERDLELAKQISLAEQRGYERGLANQRSQ
ncbi:hypothetical protein DXG03_003801 [Asterophora parasitica]|uniref:Uncharacterized protein n=1 Tax=Asterophora parasitica TaxID=117018 RepID=A0A9P7KBP0_9AGAR|nr:hypothetical protein DXG03_003801 [Asterophora parasitica]